MINIYSSEIQIKHFEKLKGLFLACSGVTGTVLGEPTQIFSFKVDQGNNQDELVRYCASIQHRINI